LVTIFCNNFNLVCVVSETETVHVRNSSPPWFAGEGASPMRSPNCRRALGLLLSLGLELGSAQPLPWFTGAFPNWRNVTEAALPEQLETRGSALFHTGG
jgi:hypothetical protein